MAVGNHKIANFTVENYAASKVKHPHNKLCSVPDPTDFNYFLTSKCFKHKALISFPDGYSAALDDSLTAIMAKFDGNLFGMISLPSPTVKLDSFLQEQH